MLITSSSGVRFPGSATNLELMANKVVVTLKSNGPHPPVEHSFNAVEKIGVISPGLFVLENAAGIPFAFFPIPEVRSVVQPDQDTKLQIGI